MLERQNECQDVHDEHNASKVSGRNGSPHLRDRHSIKSSIGSPFQSELCHTQKDLLSCSLYIPACPVPASPTPRHMTDLLTSLSQAPAGHCSYQKGGDELAPLLVSLITNDPTGCNSPYNQQSPLPLEAKSVTMSSPPSATHGGVLLQDLPQTCQHPHPWSHRRLVADSGWSFRLEAGQAWTSQAHGRVQPTRAQGHTTFMSAEPCSYLTFVH